MDGDRFIEMTKPELVGEVHRLVECDKESTKKNNMLEAKVKELRDKMVIMSQELDRVNAQLKARTKQVETLEKQQEVTLKIGNYYQQKKRKQRRVDIDDELLKKLYVDEGLSAYQISKENGWHLTTVKYRLKALGVYEGLDRYKNK